jgi:elongation factor G
VDAESGQTVLCGVGELHLSIWLEKLARRDRLQVKTGAPSVALRDTFGASTTVTYRHVRQSGGPGQFAVVTLAARPAARGSGVRFVDGTRGGVIPQAFVPAIEAGVRAACSRGLREGVPVVDVEVELLDGEVHVRDSSAVAFEVAASLAVQRAGEVTGLVRLEPLARVAVEVPEASLGAVLAELATRSGAVEVVVPGARSSVQARLPLARTFGLVTALRSRSGGRASVSLEVAGYAEAES